MEFTVRVTSKGNLRFGKIGLNRTYTQNFDNAYTDNDIPIGKKLKVSDEPFEGANVLNCTDFCFTGAYYWNNKAESRLLYFCDEGLYERFGTVPNIIYWKPI